MSVEVVRNAFRRQAKSCELLGSPFMGRLMRLCADRLQPNSAIAEQILSWPGNVSSDGVSVPLRIAGSLHGLCLDGSDPALIAAYPPNDVPDDQLWAAVDGALGRHQDRLRDWLSQAPQTNEVRRSVALIAAALWAKQQFDLPFILSELGASAGLNLGLDRFGLEVAGRVYGVPDSPVMLRPIWTGDAPQDSQIKVVEAAGVDLNPLDTEDPASALRIAAYLWPDQPERLQLTKGAIALRPTYPDAGDAAAWLETRLQTPRPGHIHMVYHTIAWQYFPPETQARCAAALASAGAAATPNAPIVHFGMEADDQPRDAAMRAQVWPGGDIYSLGRVDFHGRSIDWAPQKTTSAD
ncbi:MAG: hypothetical protein ACI8TF_002281 [Paracoccaceae bacterium]|jgi:hypothetical protein